MKQRMLFFLLLFAAMAANAQQMSCCAPSATETFSMLASNRQFVNSHAEPLPFSFQSKNGKAIHFSTPDGAQGYGWEIKSKVHTLNYLLVFHEWWGLNDYIKEEAENLWKVLGRVNIIAVDLYDQKVAATREDAVKYMQEVRTERAEAIIRGAIAYAGKNAEIYTLGWCFGGGWSLQAAILAGKQAYGCVMYYGMPEKNIEKLKTLQTGVLGIFANKDKFITPAVVDEFVENMKKAGKTLVVRRYDADHGFANPSNPVFDKQAKEDALLAELSFLKSRIR